MRRGRRKRTYEYGEEMRGPRGTGRTYRAVYYDKMGRRHKCNTHSLEWSIGGKQYRMSSRSTDESVAKQMLREKLTEIGRGLPAGIGAERLKWEDLRLLIWNDYTKKGQDLSGLEDRLNHLETVFKNNYVLSITAIRIDAYAAHRVAKKEDDPTRKASEPIGDGAAPATVNLELKTIKRMFNLGWKKKAGLLRDHVPEIELLKEHNIRQGVITPAQMAELLPCILDRDVRELVEATFLMGWRADSDMLTRRWPHIHFQRGVIELMEGEGKARTRRLFPMPLGSRLREIIDGFRARTPQDCPYVFNRKGRRILAYRRAWHAALRRLHKLHPDWECLSWVRHRMRYSAVDHMLDAGISAQQVSKMVGMGAAILSRYHQLTDRNVARAGKQYEEYMLERRAEGVVPDIERENVLPFAAGKKA